MFAPGRKIYGCWAEPSSEEFWPSRQRSSAFPQAEEAGLPDAWLSRPGGEGLCFAGAVRWALCYAAASALAPNTKKRIMLRATANHSRWMRALILPRSDS
jgi:hypothetical protein